MSTIVQVPTAASLKNADTDANGYTIALRDANGGLAANIITGTSLRTSGTYVGAVSTQTASFSAGAATHYLCDTTSGSITVTLPSASANTGVQYIFYKVAAANTLTFTGVTGTGSLSS